MKYIQLSLMGLTAALAPIASFYNDWFVCGVFSNIIVAMAAVYLTFEESISKQPEAQYLSVLMWGSLAFQIAYSFFL